MIVTLLLFVVSRQAEAILESEAPEALNSALTILSHLKESHPEITYEEGQHPFTECATFADDIKGEGYSFQNEWHYKDQPWFNEGGTIDDYDFTDPPVNAVEALTDLSSFLRGDLMPSESPYLTQIA